MGRCYVSGNVSWHLRDLIEITSSSLLQFPLLSWQPISYWYIDIIDVYNIIIDKYMDKKYEEINNIIAIPYLSPIVSYGYPKIAQINYIYKYIIV